MSSKAREALEAIRRIVVAKGDVAGNTIDSMIRSICDEALAEPPRNCDVGSTEEQGMRFKKFCNDHQAPWHGCTNCPVLMSEKCAIAWAQMPYEEVK